MFKKRLDCVFTLPTNWDMLIPDMITGKQYYVVRGAGVFTNYCYCPYQSRP